IVSCREAHPRPRLVLPRSRIRVRGISICPRIRARGASGPRSCGACAADRSDDGDTTRSVNRARALDDVALDEIDAERASRLERRAILDLLGDDTEIERARQLDHRADHLAVHAVLG